VVALLCNAGAMVRVVGVRPIGFWDLWCWFAAEMVVGGRDSCVVGVVGGGFDYEVAARGGYIGLMMDVVERGFLSLFLLAKDIDSIL
jgi:hypothetical protein